MSQDERPKRNRKATKVYDPEDISAPSPKPRAKRTRKEPFPYTNLPDNIRSKIVSFLNAGQLCQSARVSKEWQKFAEDNSTWGIKVLERFGHHFEDPEGLDVDSDEALINAWPAKKTFKQVYRALYELENQKPDQWAQFGSARDAPSKDAPIGASVSGTCPMCDGALYVVKNEVKKEEMGEDELPPSEKILQCKTPKCGFVLPYSICFTCKRPCNLMNTFICPGDKCENLPGASKIHCWACIRECTEPMTPDKCLGFVCSNCIVTVQTKKGQVDGCTMCSFSCSICNKRFFLGDKNVCRKCKKIQCVSCSKKNSCGCVLRKSKAKSEDDDEFEEDNSDEEEEEEEEDASD